MPLSKQHLLPASHLQALVDSVGERRKVVNFKRLSITDYKVDIKRHCSEKDLQKALADGGKLLLCAVFSIVAFVLCPQPGTRQAGCCEHFGAAAGCAQQSGRGNRHSCSRAQPAYSSGSYVAIPSAAPSTAGMLLGGALLARSSSVAWALACSAALRPGWKTGTWSFLKLLLATSRAIRTLLQPVNSADGVCTGQAAPAFGQYPLWHRPLPWPAAAAAGRVGGSSRRARPGGPMLAGWLVLAERTSGCGQAPCCGATSRTVGGHTTLPACACKLQQRQ